MTIVVDITNTEGQQSAIEANDGPTFRIEPLYPAVACHRPDLHGIILGFGVVVSEGPVNGYEIGYRFESIQGEPAEGHKACDHCKLIS